MSCGKYDSEFIPEWCPGCGNFDILEAVRQALCDTVEPSGLILVVGIGQASKLGFSVETNMFNGLHGRTLPLATGMQMANHRAKILIVAGDGDLFAEGGNHFIHAMRRNLDVTVLIGDNRVYGLTRGQGAPTSAEDFRSGIHKGGRGAQPLDPVLLGLVSGATFIARAYSGDKELLAGLLRQGLQHRGAALIDTLFPCVTFNNINTAAWYKKRIRPVGAGHDQADFEAACKLAGSAGEEIPVGVYYRVEREIFADRLEALAGEPLVKRAAAWTPARVEGVLDKFR